MAGKSLESTPAASSLEPTVSPGLVRVPGWDQWPWLLAGFSTRQGGGSSAYGPSEQNLGWTEHDSPATVAANRARFVQAVSGTGLPPALATIRQVHGSTVLRIEPGHPNLATPDGKAVLEADGWMTSLPGLLLGVQTADCVPVLVADTRLRAVAAFHAGWRGTLARIVEHGVEAMRLRYGSRPADLVAAIGPAIGPCCFAVGEDLCRQFAAEFPYAAMLFPDAAAQPHMDLYAANQRQLLAAGVPAGRIHTVGECTACTRLPDGRRKYFSHRAEQGITGRMLSVVGIRA